MADTKDTERPDLLALADDLAHMARHAVSDRGRLQLAADVLRAQAERAAPQPADAADGWISVDERLPQLMQGQEDDGVSVYTWNGKSVAEDDFMPEWEQPAGPLVGGWVCVGAWFDGDKAGAVTHWMLHPLPAPPSQDASKGKQP